MRRALVAAKNSRPFGCFAGSLPLDQHVHTPGQALKLGILTGNHVGQVFDHAGQMGDAFFKI